MGKKKEHSYEVHIVPGTHWDREWRYSFQETRQRLIETLERTMDILENDPRIPAYTWDGQVMAIEDYLELQPQNRSRVKKLIRQKRLEIGPWFSLPELAPLTGESVVRNLFHGITLSRKLGACLDEGFSSCSWGQISQMPQICKGFGIETYYSYHGVPAHKYPAEFFWEGSDGSRVLFIRPCASKGPFYVCELKAMVPEDPENFDTVKPGDSSLSRAYRLTDGPLTDQTPFYCDNFGALFDADILYENYKTFRNSAVKETTTPYIMLGEFGDQHTLHPAIVDMVKEIVKRDKTGDRIKLSSLKEYFQRIRKHKGKLKVFKGEMRFPAKEDSTFALCPTLSTRIYLKQYNRHMEDLLTKWAEPFSAFAWLSGNKYADKEIWHAWQMMLINHGHDNIGGCSVDAVHDDMLWRYREIFETGRAIMHRALGHLTQKTGSSETSAEEFRLVVFNPLNFSRSEIIEVYVDVPVSMYNKGFSITSPDGEPVLFQVISASRIKEVSVEMPHLVCPRLKKTRRLKIAIEVINIPSIGCAEYLISVGNSNNSIENDSCLRTGKNWIENEHMKVISRQNGTIDILHKSTGQTFKGLHYFEDNGQDRTSTISWNYRGPKHDKVYSTSRCKVKVNVIESTLKVQLRIEYDFKIPKSLDIENGFKREEARFTLYTADRRSSEMVSLPIVSTFTLYKGARRVDVETTVINKALDHRLRVMFPTNIQANYSFADSAYDVVRRSIKRPGSDNWLEIRNSGRLSTSPMLRFVDVSSQNRSLAVIVDGLTEYELIKDGQRTVAITLLRAITNGRADPDQEIPQTYGSQCQGKYTFRYAIYPHKGNWDKSNVIEEAYRHNLPLKAVQNLGTSKYQAELPKSFIKFDKNGLIVTAVKKSYKGNSLLIRLFNPLNRKIKTQMTCGFAIKTCSVADMLEQSLPMKALDVRDNSSIMFEVKPKKILTLKLAPRRSSRVNSDKKH